MGKKNKILSVFIFVLLVGSAINLQNATAGFSCIAPNDDRTITACNQTALGLRIRDGLPLGHEINIDMGVSNLAGIVIIPFGPLGGDTEEANAEINLMLNGIGFAYGPRHINMPGQFSADTAPRIPGTTPQNFATRMNFFQATLPPGDPDFDLLRITAGNGFNLPSPGDATLTQSAGGDWNVDSFFDITYRIDFIGAPGGPLAGMSGSTTGTIRMSQNGSSDSDRDGIPDGGDPDPFDPCIPDPNSPVCVPEPRCGDNVLDPATEECDDGNNISGDGCSATCKLEPQPRCGDGVLDPGEQCDDGNNVSGDGCSAICLFEPFPFCGDGVLGPGEQCDDGNNVSGDGCSAGCQVEQRPPSAVGGQIIPIDSTSLLLAGAQSTTWIIPLMLSIIGIGLFVVFRKS